MSRSRIIGPVLALLPVAVIPYVSGCDVLGQADAPDRGSAPQGSYARGVSPLANPDGTKPGLAPLAGSAQRAAARELIAGLAVKGRGSKTGYDRDEFGSAWKDAVDGVPLARNGCDTRNDLLRLHGGDVRFRSGSDCVVVSMTLYDPYTGMTIEWRKQKAAEVQIDHVVPLSYSWQMGSSRWPESKRERFANDALNLIPVQGRANSAKGDSGPASWLPPNKQIRCAYAVRFAQVAVKYEMPVTGSDRAAMLRECAG
ncbi:HNH endonuclease family protein [Streptomyces sp. SCSIO 30461]|uniref:HNH endonuclease family protein n=1 Tax=Streptomyces sp. SCSIO 30461 TaxID=3118085 RepID=UPI0030CEF720